MKKFLLAFPLLLCLILPACAGVDAKGDRSVRLGEQFTLPAGQSVTVSGENIALKFLAVTADSRCPKGAQCIWAGEAKCDVQVTYCGEVSTVNLTESGGTDGFSKTSFRGYVFSFRVQPYPELGTQISPADYELVMKIEKA